MDHLIKIGTGKIRLKRNEGRWGEEESGWHVPAAWGYLDQQTWEKIVDFQTPAKLDAISMVMLRVQPFDIDEYLRNAPVAIETNRKLSLASGSCVMQVVVMVPEAMWRYEGWCYCPIGYGDDMDWMRITTEYGTKKLRKWTWWDIKVVLPVYKLIAKVLTKLGV